MTKFVFQLNLDNQFIVIDNFFTATYAVNMEQNTLISWLEKNKTLLTYVAMGLVVVIVLVGGVTSKYFTETPHETEKVATETTTNTETVANTSATITPLSENKTIEVGRGEVVFILSSKSGSAIVREIHLHNPLKDSWVLAYDGYKTISTEPVEVFRVNLAAIEYDQVQIRTLDNFFTINNPVSVKSSESTKVELGI